MNNLDGKYTDYTKFCLQDVRTDEYNAGKAARCAVKYFHILKGDYGG